MRLSGSHGNNKNHNWLANYYVLTFMQGNEHITSLYWATVTPRQVELDVHVVIYFN